MSVQSIPFNRANLEGNELEYVRAALDSRWVVGDGQFTKRCHQWLEARTATRKALLTHSCTAALEMGVMLADVGPGDEVILPSYTFVSTANAVVLRGATPVFVDIRPDTLNLDERLVADAVTERTKAIMPVHYAGVACEMESILATAAKHGLSVIEDAAQGLGATWRGRALGAIGSTGCLSFHETKNAVAGEGGALLVNDPSLVERAEILREKGTDRSRFFRGQVDKYTWVDVGSSYLPSDLQAAVLLAQLERLDEINGGRMRTWEHYHAAFAELEQDGLVRRPVIPTDCVHNAHMYYLLLNSLEARTAALAALKAEGVMAIFHYVPLHSAPAGRRFGRTHGDDLPVTDRVGETLIRLPLWHGMEAHVERICAAVKRAVQVSAGVS
jgi:dTDP-4-amino-4,6-dideoxygalactose transaminase